MLKQLSSCKIKHVLSMFFLTSEIVTALHFWFMSATVRFHIAILYESVPSVCFYLNMNASNTAKGIHNPQFNLSHCVRCRQALLLFKMLHLIFLIRKRIKLKPMQSKWNRDFWMHSYKMCLEKIIPLNGSI